jgi:hypothetical protein
MREIKNMCIAEAISLMDSDDEKRRRAARFARRKAKRDRDDR